MYKRSEMYVCKSILVLNADNGSRLVAKYFDFDNKLNIKVEQLEFERSIHKLAEVNKCGM